MVRAVVAKLPPTSCHRILAGEPSEQVRAAFPEVLVGHHSRDDAAAVELPDGQVILSTTDFFMPVVDDPYDFGRIAATQRHLRYLCHGRPDHWWRSPFSAGRLMYLDPDHREPGHSRRPGCL